MKRLGWPQGDGKILDGMDVADGSVVVRSAEEMVGVAQGAGGGLDADTVDGEGAAAFEHVAEKDVASGYAGLNADSRTTKGVITTDDLIVDDSGKGLVLKSPDGHYWRVTVDNAGVLSTADLGLGTP